MGVTIQGKIFVDGFGRHLILRGINLPAKVPASLDPISFVGRPFPLEEADEHFLRLQSLGFTLLRLSVTWEGVEHEGIGIYDDAYLSYIKSFVDKAHEYNFKIFIDFHQDVWSRFTGGDGAPRWTLEFAGFQVEHLEDTGAAILYHPENHKPHILWATNASKLATATMFTLFFGGNTFAPKRGIQDLLQQAYFGMMQQVMERLKNHPAILGYDVMNEPLPGYIGCADLRKPFGIMQLDCSPTPYEGMRLGNGEALAVDVWKQRLLSIRPVAKQMLNVHHKRAWQEGVPCPWQEEGVYERPDYFAGYSFEEEFYKPFLKKAKACIRQIDAKTMILIAHVPGAPPPIWDLEEGEGSVVFTSHWYDGFVLATKQFFTFLGFDVMQMKPIIGFPGWMRKAFAKQIESLKAFAKDLPFLITEFGITFDLDKAYHNKALHRSFLALEDTLTSSILWNYTAHNTHEEGDHWNKENFSILSSSGLRAEEALIRPYPMATTGNPLAMHFHPKKKQFTYQFNGHGEQATEIFLPKIHFGENPRITISDGWYELEGERLKYFTSTPGTHTICCKRSKRVPGI